MVGVPEPGGKLVDAPAEPGGGGDEPEFPQAEEADDAGRPDDHGGDPRQLMPVLRLEDATKQVEQRDQQGGAQTDDRLGQREVAVQEKVRHDGVENGDHRQDPDQPVDQLKGRQRFRSPARDGEPRDHGKQDQDQRLLPCLDHPDQDGWCVEPDQHHQDEIVKGHAGDQDAQRPKRAPQDEEDGGDEGRQDDERQGDPEELGHDSS